MHRTQFVHLRQPTISVLCPTSHPAPIVEAALEPLREVVDEIIIAAELAATTQQVAAYASVADRVIRYEHTRSNSYWSWLVTQAHGDWILIVDGDELPSQAFLDALPELVRDRRVSQYVLPIHWPWRTDGSGEAEAAAASFGRVIDEPWASDRRLRLFRHDFRTPFRPLLHRINEPVGPVVYRDDLPFLHLDFVFPDEGRRRAKVRQYERVAAPFLNPQGEPFNLDLYVPERRGREPHVEPLAPADLERVRSAVQREEVHRAEVPMDQLPVVLAATLDAAIGDAPLSAPDERGTLTIQSVPTFTVGTPDNTVWVRVEHHGTVSWPGELYPGRKIRIGVRLESENGSISSDVARAAFPYRLDPGEVLTMPVNVPAPAAAGAYRLTLDFVDEVRWLGCETTRSIEVLSAPGDVLAAAAGEVDELVPLAAVWALRKRVGRTDGLAGRGAVRRAATDPALALALHDRPDSGAGVDGAAVDRIAALLRRDRPETVVAFGLDAPLVLGLASLLRELGEGPRLVAIHDDPRLTGQVDQSLVRAGFRERVDLLVVPIAPAPDGAAPPGYQLTDDAGRLLSAHSPACVILNGPPFGFGTVDGVLPQLQPYLRGAAPVLLLGALVDCALLTAEAWRVRPGVTVHGLRATADGLLEATLTPGAPTA